MYDYRKITDQIRNSMEYVIYESSTPRTPRLGVRSLKDAEKYIQILNTFQGRQSVFTKEIDDQIVKYYLYHNEMTLDEISNKLNIKRKTLDKRIAYLKSISQLPTKRRTKKTYDEKKLIDYYCCNIEMSILDIAHAMNVSERTINLRIKNLKESKRIPLYRRCKKNKSKIEEWWRKKYIIHDNTIFADLSLWV